MAIKTLFIPLSHAETLSATQSNKDKYDRVKEKTKEFDTRSMSELTVRNNAELSKLNTHLNAFNLKTNIEGGYSIVSVTPVLGTETQKVDEDEPMLPLVHTTGFLVILHKEDVSGGLAFGE